MPISLVPPSSERVMFFCRIAVFAAENGSCPEYSLLEQVDLLQRGNLQRRAEPEGGQAARDVFVAIAYFIYIFLHPFRADARASSWKYHTTDSRVADARV